MMDQAQPLPISTSITPQPSGPNLKTPLLIAAGALIFTAGVGAGILAVKYISPQSTALSTPAPSPISQATPTPDLNREPAGSAATADWETYFDPEFPVQFKYPSDWEVKDTNYRNFETAVVGTKNAILDEKSPGYLKVSYPFCHKLDNPQQRVPCYPSYLDTLNAVKFNLAPSSIKEDKIFVDGIEATQIAGIIKETLPAKAGFFRKVAVIPLGKYQLFAEIFHQNTESALDQILSTFRFVE